MKVTSSRGDVMYIYGTNQNDNLYGTANADWIYGYDGADFIDGGDGNDYIDGGVGGDWMVGGKGNDQLVSLDGEGPDAMDGGADTDLAWIGRTSYSGNLIVDLGKAGTQDIGDGTSLTSIEQVAIAGGSGDDSFTG